MISQSCLCIARVSLFDCLMWILMKLGLVWLSTKISLGDGWVHGLVIAELLRNCVEQLLLIKQ